MDFNSLTTSEIITYGVVYTIEGLLVVFSVLILIMLAIYAMGLFSGEKKSKKAPDDTAAAPIEDASAIQSVDEGELIAVLTAAVAACMGTSVASVNIKSYKKISSAWGNAARREALNNRI